MFIAGIVILIISLLFSSKIKNRYNGLEILEIKLKAFQKRIEKEEKELNALKERLEEQKEVLNKKWDQIQNDYAVLEERAIKLEHERKLLERQKSDFANQKVEMEQELTRIEKLNHYLEKKREQVKREFKVAQNELEEKNKQINTLIANLDIEKNQLKIEKQRIEKSEKYIIEKFNELKLLKIQIETDKNELLSQEKNLQNEDEQHKLEIKNFEIQKRDIINLKQEIDDEKDRLQKQKKEIDEKYRNLEAIVRWVKEEKETIENENQEIKNGTGQGTINFFRSIEETKEKSPQKFFKNKISIKGPPYFKSEIQLTETNDKKKLPKIIPELICWRREERWHIGIKLSGKLHDDSSFKIMQNNINLKRDEINNEYWAIKSMSPILIEWKERGTVKQKQFEINIADTNKPLLFKLNRQNQNFGRSINYPTTGYYLLIVPEDWQRDENLSGPPPFEPESITLKAYKGHYFILREYIDTIIAFQKVDGTIISINPKNSRFFLKGNRILDANEGAAPLFGEELPKIVDKLDSWEDIGTIVVGEDGERVEHLKWSITPQLGRTEQDLNLFDNIEISETKGACFFIRIYDLNDDLIGSFDFRYIQGLKSIKIFEHPPLPGPNGHQSVSIKFYHNKSCSIDIVKNENNERHNLILILNDEETVATIPPDPALDLTEWEISDLSGRKVSIKIFMLRVWWGLADESDDIHKKNASDRLVTLSLDVMKFSTNSGLCIWLPRPYWGKEVFIGLEQEKRKTYLSKRNEASIFIPLREFLDFADIKNQKEKRVFKLWLDDKKDEAVPIGELVLRLLYCKAKNCDFKTKHREEMIQHIKEYHISYFFKILSYDEIRLKYNRHLPLAIYQCGYCDAYFHADNRVKNPTSTIINHIEQCPEANREEGRLFIRFRQVTDIFEIRQKVISDLPHVRQCLLCEKYFKNQNDDSLLNHLITDHESDVLCFHRGLAHNTIQSDDYRM